MDTRTAPPPHAPARTRRAALGTTPLKRLRALAILLVLSLLAAAAAQATVVDDLGREVRVEQPPQRVVSMVPTHTETVCALGACERLVGVDRFSNHPERVRELPSLGSAFDGNVEAIVALQPDLVLVDEYSELAGALGQLGIPAFAGTPQSVEETYAVIEKVGILLGREAEAARLVGTLRGRIEALAERAAALEPVSVYYEIDATPYTAGPGSFIGELIDLAGGDNIVPPGLGEFPQLDPERVLAADPEVIVLADAPHGESEDTLAQRAGWSELRALREGRVVELNQQQVDLLSRAGPRLDEALRLLAELLHPAAF